MSGEIRDVLIECLTLKDVARAGWVRSEVKNPESVAAHSWGVAWLAVTLCPEGLDVGISATIAILHDVAEIRVGDITPVDGINPADKREMEEKSTRDILESLGADKKLFELWLDYEDGRTPEGRFVKACDKLDMALQATLYSENQGLDLSDFIDSALEHLDEGELRDLAGG